MIRETRKSTFYSGFKIEWRVNATHYVRCGVCCDVCVSVISLPPQRPRPSHQGLEQRSQDDPAVSRLLPLHQYPEAASPRSYP